MTAGLRRSGKSRPWGLRVEGIVGRQGGLGFRVSGLRIHFFGPKEGFEAGVQGLGFRV